MCLDVYSFLGPISEGNIFMKFRNVYDERKVPAWMNEVMVTLMMSCLLLNVDGVHEYYKIIVNLINVQQYLNSDEAGTSFQ